jgi:ADP-heptose:LPS heptosyltransferase
MCPDVKSNDIFVQNRVKINIMMNKVDVAKAKKISNNKAYRLLKKITYTIKDFFRNFFIIIKIITVNKNEDNVYVAFICYGGFGDITRYKSVILELIKMYPEIVIDIYNKKAQPFFKDIKNIRFYLNIDAVNTIKKYYDIVYEARHCNVKLLFLNKNKHFPCKILNNLNEYRTKYPFCFNKSPLRSPENFVKNNINIVNLLKLMSGVDNVYDISFTILAEKQPLDKFQITNKTEYITFQCGSGTSGHLNDIKCWDVEQWKKLLIILKNKLDKNIKFIQIGTGDYHFSEADINLLGKTSLSELFYILQKSLLHIDIDGACSHFAKAVGTKSLVIFGTTDGQFSGYPENINILSSLCSSCWTTSEICPIGYAKPMCMQSITPEFVAEKVIEYFTEKTLLHKILTG